MKDSKGIERKTGEEWLIRESGLYLPGVYEEIVNVYESYILTAEKAIHLKATREFQDNYGIKRKAGEEYLITN